MHNFIGLYFFLKSRETNRLSNRDLPSPGSLPKCPYQLELCSVKTRSKKSVWTSHVGGQDIII